MHLADLHLGKRVNGFSMMEDQEYILNRILEIMEEEQPDGLLIAGDVYDKTIPPAEAVRRMDDFLTAVAAKHVPVFLISGNHDSAERVAFGHQLMQGSGIWISPVYDGTIRHHTLEDRWGEVNIYLIPFLRPSVVRSFFPDVEIEDYTDALRTIIEDLQVDTSRRNVVLAHQFVTAAGALPETCDSEQLSVGGLDRVDGSVLPFRLHPRFGAPPRSAARGKRDDSVRRIPFEVFFFGASPEEERDGGGASGKRRDGNSADSAAASERDDRTAGNL